MESLAYLVLGLLLAQLAIGVLTLVFSVLYRRLGKFAITSQVLIVLLAIEMIWGFTISNAFGLPAAIFVTTSALIRYLPKAN
jgi:hypothetical protein